jgi:hypothetical protein
LSYRDTNWVSLYHFVPYTLHQKMVT